MVIRYEAAKAPTHGASKAAGFVISRCPILAWITANRLNTGMRESPCGNAEAKREYVSARLNVRPIQVARGLVGTPPLPRAGASLVAASVGAPASAVAR